MISFRRKNRSPVRPALLLLFQFVQIPGNVTSLDNQTACLFLIKSRNVQKVIRSTFGKIVKGGDFLGGESANGCVVNAVKID